MDWRPATLVWIARLTGLGLLLYSVHLLGGFFSEVWYWSNKQLDVPGLIGTLISNLPAIVFFFLAWQLLLGRRLLRRMLHGLDGNCFACGHPLPEHGSRCTECGVSFAKAADAGPGDTKEDD